MDGRCSAKCKTATLTPPKSGIGIQRFIGGPQPETFDQPFKCRAHVAFLLHLCGAMRMKTSTVTDVAAVIGNSHHPSPFGIAHLPVIHTLNMTVSKTSVTAASTMMTPSR